MTAPAQSIEQGLSDRATSRQPRSLTLGRLITFFAAAGGLVAYALRGGGSYDLVTFEEYGVVIWWVLALGVALGLLPRARLSRSVLLLLAALAAYSGWTALSLMWTQSSELTTVEIARSLDYLGLVALVGSLLDRDNWRMAAAGLGFGGMIVCLVALGTRLVPSVFGVDHLDAFLHSDRLSVPFGYWNAVAAWGAMCTALALAWSAHDSSRIRRAVALGLVPLAMATTYLTYSRAGLFGAGLGLIAVVALSRNRITALVHAAVAAAGAALVVIAIRDAGEIAHATGTRGAGEVIGALLFGAALGVGTALLTRRTGVDRWRAPTRLRRPLALLAVLALLVPGAALAPRAWHSFTRNSNSATPNTNTTARLATLSGTRYPVWKAAFKEFMAHPADGTGAGTFEFTWDQRSKTLEFVRDAHNIWLENMSELGLPGLLLIVAVAVAALAVAAEARLRARRGVSVGAATAFLAVMLVYLMHASVDWMWESTAVTVLALGGVAIVGGRLSGARPRLRMPVRAALFAVAAVAALAQLPGILSNKDIRRSQAAAQAGDVPAALALARDAVSAEPWSASAHEQEALVLESTGALLGAKRQESEAVSHETSNYVHYLVRARIESELGQLNAAVRDYDQARSLRPHAAVFAITTYVKAP